MNVHQLAHQVQHKLETVTWPKGSQSVVFGSRNVKVISGDPTDEQIPPSFPFSLVSIGTGANDADHPDHVMERLKVLVAVSVKGDPMGQAAVLGGVAPDLGKSGGRGVLEVAERARAAVGDLTGADGATLVVSQITRDVPRRLGQMGSHGVVAEFTIEAACTVDPYWIEPQMLAVAGGNWTWSGAHCKELGSFLQFRLGYRSGSAASSPTDPGVTILGGTSDEYLTGFPPVAGQFYSIWADYAPRGTNTAEETSDGSLVGAFLET